MKRNGDSGCSVQLGGGTLGLLGVLFVALKLTHVIDWSWWFVLMPFYFCIALAAFVFLTIIVIGLIASAFD